MAENVVPLRAKVPESEKITINLGYVDLGQIDLLVQEGFYSNRTDFIRTAIRNQLQRHEDAVNASASRKRLGLATIAPDVTPALARATISSVVVLGALQATPEVKAALADRTH